MKLIPGKCTGLIQRVDFYFLWSYKSMVTCFRVVVMCEWLIDINFSHRDYFLRLQSFLHFQFLALRFRNVINYAFYKCRYTVFIRMVCIIRSTITVLASKMISSKCVNIVLYWNLYSELTMKKKIFNLGHCLTVDSWFAAKHVQFHMKSVQILYLKIAAIDQASASITSYFFYDITYKCTYKRNCIHYFR